MELQAAAAPLHRHGRLRTQARCAEPKPQRAVLNNANNPPAAVLGAHLLRQLCHGPLLQGLPQQQVQHLAVGRTHLSRTQRGDTLPAGGLVRRRGFRLSRQGVCTCNG
jgi:hypothetical protein